MGKRVQGQAFLDGVIDHGAHFCTYLLGTDMEMNTPDGFAADELGDRLRRLDRRPGVGHPARVPWLEKTALVLSDTVDHHGDEIPVSPRTMLKRGRRARRRAWASGVKAGSELEYYLLTDTYEQAWRKGYVGLERFGYYNEDYHLLQATKGEPIHGKLRNLMTAGRHPDRVQQGRGGARPARGQHPLRPTCWRWPTGGALQARRQGDRLPQRLRPHLHGQAGPHLDRVSGHLHMSASGTRAARGRSSTTPRPSPTGCRTTMRHFLGGMMKYSRELALFIAPNVNSYKRYAVASWAPVNVVWGRDNRTTGFRVVGDGSGLHIENRFPGGDMNPYLAYAAVLGAGLLRHRARDRAAGRVPRQRLRGHRLRPHAAGAARGDPRAREQRGGGRDLRGRRGGPLPQRGARGAGDVRRRGPSLGPRAIPGAS